MLNRIQRYAGGVLAGAALFLLPSANAEEADQKVKVSVTRFYEANSPQGATTARLLEVAKEHPEMYLEQWGGIKLPGGGAKASLMMSIAGKTAPDIGESWFHIIGSESRQSFLCPLNEWIGEDEDGNGMIDDDETTWEGWKKVPPLWRRVAQHDGKVYGIPQAGTSRMGVIFRTDLVRAAGLNPNRPPETWAELKEWCYKLTDPAKAVPGAVYNRGQRGIALTPYGFTWLPWVQSAGGDPIVQIRTSPTTGKKHAFAPDETAFLSPEGEDLASVEPVWQADFTSPAAKAAAGLYHDLLWQRWITDPASGKAVTLTLEEAEAGQVSVNGQPLSFKPEEVVTGVARGQVAGQRGTNAWDLISK
ncbi:MAG: ABC transporter substrate-binding protein, partial [Planctomycetota bacterium]